jgi:hypothetical protein
MSPLYLKKSLKIPKGQSETVLSPPEESLGGSCYSIFSFICMVCRSLFVLLYFYFWPLFCLFFFDIRFLIAPLRQHIWNFYLNLSTSSVCKTLSVVNVHMSVLVWYLYSTQRIYLFLVSYPDWYFLHKSNKKSSFSFFQLKGHLRN